jgi:hypothetical protein
MGSTFLDPATRAAASVHARQTAEAMPFDLNVRQTLELFMHLQPNAATAVSET